MFGTEIIWPQVTHVLKLKPQRKLENKTGRDGSIVQNIQCACRGPEIVPRIYIEHLIIVYTSSFKGPVTSELQGYLYSHAHTHKYT